MEIKNCAILTVENIKYVSAKDLCIHFYEFFYGCDKKSRNIIKIKNILTEHYVWIKCVRKKYLLSQKSYRNAVLYLSKKWVSDNVPGFSDKKKIIGDVMKLPPVVVFNDNERWLDADGQPYDIDIRGEKTLCGMYFKAADVGHVFDRKSIETGIISKKCKYVIHKHYIFFVTVDGQKKIYLTMRGLLRFVFVTKDGEKNDKIEYFRENMISSLFTLKTGTQEQKIKLSASILGIDQDIIRKVLKLCSRNISCIYFFTLGTVRELRKIMDIDPKYTNDQIVGKLGKSIDLDRRTGEHERNYGSIERVELKLKYFCTMDEKCLTGAENLTKNFLKDKKFDYKNSKELVIVDKKFLREDIKTHYDSLVQMFK